MKRVLSIDGGGIRGLIPAVICQKLEERAGVALSSLFDLIVGTSTGGILALGLAYPPKGKSATDLVKFYREKGPHIFSNPRAALNQWRSPKFSSEALCRAVDEVFGSTKMSEAVVEVLATTYDARLRRPLYLNSAHCKRFPNEDRLMREVAVATSAAPTYFPSCKLGDHILVDGGLVANNPACVGFAHAKHLWPDEDILLLSIGTGSLNRPLCSTLNWGKAQWVRPLIDCLFDGTSQATDDFFRHAHLRNYLRLQGNLSELTESLDGATEVAMSGLEGIAIGIVKGHEGPIIDFLERLKEAGQPFEAKITRPQNGRLVSLGSLAVEGTAKNYHKQILYLFTGNNGKYWPSSRLKPENGNWFSSVHVGFDEPNATVSLVKVEKPLEDYIEFYRANAAKLSYPGMQIHDLDKYSIDRIRVNLDHRPIRS